MKKLILSVFLSGAFLSTINTLAQISVGPKIGLNLSTIHGNAGDNTLIKTKAGFQIGGMLNAQVNDYFSIRPELMFNNIGSKYQDGILKATYNTNYLSLPINFVGQYPISDNFKLQAFAGPYAAIGLGGTYKFEDSAGDIETPIKMKKQPTGNNSNFYMNAWDFGLNFGIGFQYTSFVFTTNYALGLTNIEPHYEDAATEDQRGKNGKAYNRNITFSVAYLFGGK